MAVSATLFMLRPCLGSTVPTCISDVSHIWSCLGSAVLAFLGISSSLVCDISHIWLCYCLESAVPYIFDVSHIAALFGISSSLPCLGSAILLTSCDANHIRSCLGYQHAVMELENLALLVISSTGMSGINSSYICDVN